MTLTRSRLALALAAGALLPAAMYAQQSTGSLSGRITAADGTTPKAGVLVTVIQKGTNLTRKTTTDAEGNWRAPALPVGDYKITLQSGSQTQVINRTVSLGLDTLVRFKWPAEAGATVVVEALAAGVDQVNTTSAEMGVNVDSQVLSSMPIIDRNVNSAAVLAPGVQIIQGSQVDPTKKTSTYIVSGEGQGRGTNFNVDGADNNSSDVGGYVMPIPFDAIDQFQVVTNQYKAEFGRSNAGFLNVVTKSGSNEFMGIVNYQYTNQAMRAKMTDEFTKLDNNQSIYSATVSGPIIKDTLFYMVSAEKTKSTAGQVFDQRAIAAIPALGNEPNDTTKMNLYTKLDWNINQTWLASFKYARYYDISANQTFPHANAVGNYVDPSMLGTNRDDTSWYGLKLTGTFGSIVWESTANFFDYTNSIRPSNPGENNGTSIEIRVPYVTRKDRWRRGQDPNSWQNTGVKRTQWKNELTWTASGHNVKGGFDWQKTDYPLEEYFYHTPSIYRTELDNTAAIPTGGVPVTFANAYSPLLSQSQVAEVYLDVPFLNPPTKFNNYGIYLQDEWTINNRWSVYYGWRVDWDTQLDYYNKFDSMYAEMHAANPQLAGIGDQAPRTHKYSSPRLQVLYKPFGDDNLTFKLGYGKFVASTIDNVVGFSRALNAPVNGMPRGYVYNANSPKGVEAAGAAGATPVSFAAGSTLTYVGNFAVVLPADLTPYNYANNIGGLRTLFDETIYSKLTAANFSTGGKQLLASNFAYPTSQTLTLGMTYKFSERSAIDLTLLYSKTQNITQQFTTDGSAQQVWSPTPHYAGTPYEPDPANRNPAFPSYDQGDSIFMSNQTASTRQLQVKYTYTTSKMSFLATFVAKDSKSSAGGDVGSFSNGGGADFYGAGVQEVWATGPERQATGTEALSGSFSFNYRFDFGTSVNLLGQWHSGKYYDVFLGGPYADNATTSNPDPIAGVRNGDWAMDISLRIAHTIKLGKKLTIEPYIQVQNLLNNYDYGTNYDNAMLNSDGTYNTAVGTRLSNFQVNAPRTAAVGLHITW